MQKHANSETEKTITGWIQKWYLQSKVTKHGCTEYFIIVFLYSAQIE